MKPFLIALPLLVILCSCDQTRASQQSIRMEQKNDPFEKDKAFNYHFLAKTETASQLLSINILKNRDIEFKVVYTTKGNDKPVILTGKATLVPRNGDGESIIGNTGELIFVEEYIFEKDGCKLYLLVDEELQAAQLELRDCQQKKDPFGLNYELVMMVE